MTVSTEGEAPDLFPISDCSFGNTVTYGRISNESFSVYEMVIMGRVITLTDALGEI